MKLKRWHMYFIVTLCFVICFVAINTKYDRFYRVNGINNDNRALIELYLDEKEQEYLVENAIAVNQFIKYIDYPEFYLPYYSFYNALDKTNHYSNYDELISVGNQLASRLEISFLSGALSKCNTLIKNDLVDAYINQEVFDFNNIDYYQLLRSVYADDDYSYISDTNNYLGIMDDNNKKLYDTFKLLCNDYTKQGMATLFNNDISSEVKRIYNPSDSLLVVNDNTFIGGYEPKNLVTALGIPRTNYSMYLQEETYLNLVEMYQACSSQCGRSMILTKTYISYDVANLEDKGVKAGYNEYQLGTTVSLQKQEISVEDFDKSDIFAWLNEHSYEYGFILRYPSDKTTVTNHEYNPAIFRYVGKDVATSMHEQNLSLEEYNEINQK